MNIILRHFLSSLWIVSIFYNWDQLFVALKHIFLLFSFSGVFILKVIEYAAFLFACWLCYECISAFVHIKRFQPSHPCKIQNNTKIQEVLKEIHSNGQTRDFEDNDLYKQWIANESVHQELGIQ